MTATGGRALGRRGFKGSLPAGRNGSSNRVDRPATGPVAAGIAGGPTAVVRGRSQWTGFVTEQPSGVPGPIMLGPWPDLPWVAQYGPWQPPVVLRESSTWWQVSGRREKLVYPHTRAEFYHTTHCSRRLELGILGETALVVFENKGACRLASVAGKMLLYCLGPFTNSHHSDKVVRSLEQVSWGLSNVHSAFRMFAPSASVMSGVERNWVLVQRMGFKLDGAITF